MHADVATPFVGRERELERLCSALELARASQGRLFVLRGEPGIGKSRLAAELCALAERSGFSAYWGRVWEAGGAPAFWPWIEILRALGDELADAARSLGVRARELSRLLPELASELGEAPSTPDVDSAQARFALFDAIVSTLRAIAERRPLVLVIDDAHLADTPSLLALELMARSLRNTRLLVIVTHRDAEARLDPAVAALLGKIARNGEPLDLGRLDRSALAAWIGEATARPASDAVTGRLYAQTEGNPLFVAELLRMLAARGDLDAAAALRSADGVHSVIRERIERLDATVKDVLAVASVVGRDFDASAVALVAARPLADVEAAIETAARAGVVELRGGRASFAHIVIRDVFFSELPRDRRRELHWRLGQRLAAQARTDEALLPAAALHLLRGADAGDLAEASRTALDAGRSMLKRFALEDVVALAREAIALRQECDGDAVAADLVLLEAEGLIRSGRSDEGRARAAHAAAIAERLDDDTRFARAALTYGAELLRGERDPVMVELLEKARERLGARDDGLAIRVSARLSAAMIPSISDDSVNQRAQEIAAEAVARARRLGDPSTLLYAYHWAAQPLGLASMADTLPEQVLELRKMVVLARELGHAPELLQAQSWIVTTLVEMGDLSACARAIDEYERMLSDLPLPAYAERLPVMRSAIAALEGRFEQARVPDWLSPRIGFFIRFATMYAMGDEEGLGAFEQRFGSVPPFPGFGPLRARMLVAQKRFDEARAELSSAWSWMRALSSMAVRGPAFGRAMGGIIADCALSVEDDAFVRTIRDVLRTYRERWLVFGMSFSSIGPAAWFIARLAARVGDEEEARSEFESAIAMAESAGARPFVARIERDYAAFLLSRGEAQRGRELLAKSIDAAEALGMTAFAEHSRRLSDVPIVATKNAPPPLPTLRFDSGTCTVTWGARVVRLKESHGLRYLSHLVASPEREVHVSELLAMTRAGEARPRSDAGPILDARAKAAYRERIEELREIAEEAAQNNDRGREAKARAELDAIAAELARAVGLGGRDRRALDSGERARVNATLRIRKAIKKIAEHDASLGHHLDTCVRTGAFCVYAPPPGG